MPCDEQKRSSGISLDNLMLPHALALEYKTNSFYNYSMVAEAFPKFFSSDQSVKYASDYTHVVNWQNSSWHVFKQIRMHIFINI